MLRLNTIYAMDVLEGLRLLPDQSVDMVMTSPPYWGLRAYGTKLRVWGGDGHCGHEWQESKSGLVHENRNNLRGSQEVAAGATGTSYIRKYDDKIANTCVKCGAWRGELGLEPTFELYVQHLCAVFDEVWRVLKSGGHCWVNLGDTYGGSNCGYGQTRESSGFQNVVRQGYYPTSKQRPLASRMTPKCLLQIPSRFAIEMVSRGWILRNRIIWHKPNCMPSSAKDRFTVDFEDLFFFTRSLKYYFETQYESWTDKREVDVQRALFGHKRYGGKWREDVGGALPEARIVGNPLRGRHKRCVWTIPPRPFLGAHFAVFPEAIVETPIKSGCPELVCRKCGKPMERVVVNRPTYVNELDLRARAVVRRAGGNQDGQYFGDATKDYAGSGAQNPSEAKRRILKSMMTHREIVGWSDCGCGAGFRPGVVLDPFSGSGTTCLVAEKLGRSWIGFDLKPEYVEMARRRILKYQSERLMDLVNGRGKRNGGFRHNGNGNRGGNGRVNYNGNGGRVSARTRKSSLGSTTGRGS
jgi:site-specific DNA-methyltransferase (adenine-specific)